MHPGFFGKERSDSIMGVAADALPHLTIDRTGRGALN
jgi:hypothetical protein